MFNCITDVGSTLLIHYSDPHYIRPDDEAYLVTGLYLRFVPMTLRYNIWKKWQSEYWNQLNLGLRPEYWIPKAILTIQ